MLLYRTLRFFLRGALGLYFVDIQSLGRELIPPTGPVIFAANHPNSIMDTVILGTQTTRTVCYLARSGLFGNLFVKALFSACGVIPLYRAQDDPSQMHKNQDSFRCAYELLAAGGCLGIFPEGRNAPQRHVQEIRTGTARIALGALEANEFELGVKIVPVGLNFVQRDRFLSSVLIRFGGPINVLEYADAYKADARSAIRALTDDLQHSIRDAATHMDDDRTARLAIDIYSIYGSKLLTDLIEEWGSRKNLAAKLLDDVQSQHNPKSNLDDMFWVKQRIGDAISHFSRLEPDLVDEVEQQITAYKHHLAQVKLRHDFLDRRPETLSSRREAIKFTVYAIVFAPVAAWGFLGNAPAYAFMRMVSWRAPDEAQRAIHAFAASIVAFPIYWAAQVWALWSLTGSIWLCLAHVLTIPFLGTFFLRYRRQLAKYRRRILARTIFVSNRFLVMRLAAERQRLLTSFDSLRRRFTEETETQIDQHLNKPN